MKTKNKSKNYLNLNNIEKFNLTTFIFLTLAAIINSVGVGVVLIPAHLIDAGNSGLSYILSDLTKINISIFILLLNIPFYVLSYKVLGIHSVVYSLFSIIMYSFFMYLFGDILNLYNLNIFTELTGGGNENNHLMLAAIFGGLLSGAGSGFTIKNGSSFDGIEILAVILTKRIGVSVGQIMMFFNIIMFSIAGVIMGSILLPLYSIIAYFIGIKAIDFTIEGFDKAVSAIIITAKGKKIANEISRILNRSITILEGKGYYSDTQKDVLYCVVNRFEVVTLKKIIFKADPNAFITFSAISDVMGTPVKFKNKRNKKAVK